LFVKYIGTYYGIFAPAYMDVCYATTSHWFPNMMRRPLAGGWRIDPWPGAGEEMNSHLPSLPASPWRGTRCKGRRLLAGHDEWWNRPPGESPSLEREENLFGIKLEIAPPLPDKAEDHTSKLTKVQKLGTLGFMPKCRGRRNITTSSQRN